MYLVQKDCSTYRKQICYPQAFPVLVWMPHIFVDVGEYSMTSPRCLEVSAFMYFSIFSLELGPTHDQPETQGNSAPVVGK